MTEDEARQFSPACVLDIGQVAYFRAASPKDSPPLFRLLPTSAAVLRGLVHRYAASQAAPKPRRSSGRRKQS